MRPGRRFPEPVMERMTAVQGLHESGYMLTYSKQPPGNTGGSLRMSRCTGAGLRAAAGVMMDRVRLERYLSGRLGDDVRITSLSQAFPGLSRETWLVRLDRGRADTAVEQGLVVRADSAGGPFPPVPLEYEYQVYVHLARTEVPVARPLWFDASPEPSDGRALFVREMVEGS